MKVILMTDVPALGRRGETRDVSNGYARNFLLPRKLAVHGDARQPEERRAPQAAARARRSTGRWRRRRPPRPASRA